MSAEDPIGGRHRPRVHVAVTMSLDGRVALRRDQLLMHAPEQWRSLCPPSADALHAARSSRLDALQQPIAVLEGSGSLVPRSAGPLEGLADNHSRPLDELYTDFLPQHPADRPGQAKWFTVVDSRGRVRWHTNRGGGFELLVLVSTATPPAYLAYLREEQIAYLVAGHERVNLTDALGRMRTQLGVASVISTAGGGLNGALLRAGLVDQVDIHVLPALIGGSGTPTIFDGTPLADDESPVRLRLVSSHAEPDGMLALRYTVEHHPSDTDQDPPRPTDEHHTESSSEGPHQ